MKHVTRYRRLRPADDQSSPGGLISPSQFASLVRTSLQTRRRQYTAWFDPKTNRTHIRLEVKYGGGRSIKYFPVVCLVDAGNQSDRVIQVQFDGDHNRHATRGVFEPIRRALNGYAASVNAQLDLLGGMHFVMAEDDILFPDVLITPSRLLRGLHRELGRQWDLMVDTAAQGEPPESDQPAKPELILQYASHSYLEHVGTIMLPTRTKPCHISVSLAKQPRLEFVMLLQLLLLRVGDHRTNLFE